MAARSHQTAYEQAVRLMRSEAVKAFDLASEPAALRDAYGRNLFGQGCLLARRLVERGVPFVEVTLGGVQGSQGLGWDTHQHNFDSVKQLCGVLDPGWATLMADLKDRGLLDTTLIVWMGEFGRTPKINPQGRPRPLPQRLDGRAGRRRHQGRPGRRPHHARRREGRGAPRDDARPARHGLQGAGPRPAEAEHLQRRPADPPGRSRGKPIQEILA